MNDISKKYGELGNDFAEWLREQAKLIIAEMIEPICILKKFEAVDVLTLDEACEVLRLQKQIVRDACLRNELPHERVGRTLLFPKKNTCRLSMR